MLPEQMPTSGLVLTSDESKSGANTIAVSSFPPVNHLRIPTIQSRTPRAVGSVTCTVLAHEPEAAVSSCIGAKLKLGLHVRSVNVQSETMRTSFKLEHHQDALTIPSEWARPLRQAEEMRSRSSPPSSAKGHQPINTISTPPAQHSIQALTSGLTS
jgi:hypothetical protein